MRKTAALSIAVLLACALTASAAVERYTADVSHSSVGFSIRHFFSKVPGRFGKFTVELSGDKADLSKATVTTTIEAASIDTGNEARDKHLRSADFFDAEKFPTITFTSTSVTVKSPTNIIVSGDLTMRGVTKKVDLDVAILGSGPDAWGGYRAGFQGKTTINRKDFGILWNKVLDTGGAVLGDEVEIVLDIEAVREAAAK